MFLVKFEHGENFIEKVKELAVKENISLATISFLGALIKADVVTGPQEMKLPAVPTWVSFSDGREVLGFGTMIEENGQVKIHAHSTFGKGETALTGCLRKSCEVFATVEAVITEVKGMKVSRQKDADTGCDLLAFE